MSVKAMAWAWEQNVSSTVKLVLIALADHTDNDGLCWPGQKGIGDKCGIARETVNRALAKLVELKLIEAVRRFDEDGHQRSNRYQLALKRGGCVTDDHKGGELESRGGVTDDHTESSLGTINRNTNVGQSNLSFLVFYDAYPRHEAKTAAIKAWRTLNPDAELADRIMQDIERFKDRERQFIPLPATYLRGRRWEDERAGAGVSPNPVPEVVAVARRESVEAMAEPMTPEQRAASAEKIHAMLKTIGRDAK